MRRSITIILVILLAASAWAQYPDNRIGLVVDEGEGPSPWNAILNAWSPGTYTIYLVCYDPVNENTGNPITTLGGFECYIDLADPAWFFHEIVLPPNIIDFAPADNSFFCAGLFPVVPAPFTGADSYTPLATITIGTWAVPGPSGVYIAPYNVLPSIPGHMAITDANDEYSLSKAYPTTGTYEVPVLGINMTTSPEEDTSWSDVKALYR